MAKQRMVNTKFWIDDYIVNLDPIQKLLFLYFLTNPYTDICGVYEIPLRHIELETGIRKGKITEILKKFEFDDKIIYQNGWVGIKNFAKHQLNNPKVKTGIEEGFKRAPEALVDRLNVKNIGYDRLSHLIESNLTKENPNSKGLASKEVGDNTGDKRSGMRPISEIIKQRTT